MEQLRILSLVTIALLGTVVAASGGDEALKGLLNLERSCKAQQLKTKFPKEVGEIAKIEEFLAAQNNIEFGSIARVFSTLDKRLSKKYGVEPSKQTENNLDGSKEETDDFGVFSGIKDQDKADLFAQYQSFLMTRKSEVIDLVSKAKIQKLKSNMIHVNPYLIVINPDEAYIFLTQGDGKQMAVSLSNDELKQRTWEDNVLYLHETLTRAFPVLYSVPEGYFYRPAIPGKIRLWQDDDNDRGQYFYKLETRDGKTFYLNERTYRENNGEQGWAGSYISVSRDLPEIAQKLMAVRGLVPIADQTRAQFFKDYRGEVLRTVRDSRALNDHTVKLVNLNRATLDGLETVLNGELYKIKNARTKSPAYLLHVSGGEYILFSTREGWFKNITERTYLGTGGEGNDKDYQALLENLFPTEAPNIFRIETEENKTFYIPLRKRGKNFTLPIREKVTI
jgi:hypothetical protein